MASLLGRRLRLGMVGGGAGAFIGGVHRIAARLDDRFELVAAVLSSDSEQSNRYARELLIPRSYDHYEAMAAAESRHPEPIDLVAIVTPNDLHHAVARAFLNAGIHVMCDKPMTMDVAEAEDLARLVRKRGLLFGLTHTYSGYPLVRQMRDLVLAGALGAIRHVQVEYAQGWLASAIEQKGAKQAMWRTDPARSGAGGCLGDIATHAFHLAQFTTGLLAEEVSCELTTFVPGRRLDDNVQMMLRFAGGTRGSLWASQVAIGEENNLNLRIYGEDGSLCWRQEDPNLLKHTPFDEPTRAYTRGGPSATASAVASTRLPGGHPEGYLEAFGQLYRDMAELVTARLQDREPAAEARLLPGCDDGVRGMHFIDSCVRSARANGAWTRL